MIRMWKDKWDVPMGWLLIDTLAYNFLKNWEYKNNSYTYYDWMVRDFFEYLKKLSIKLHFSDNFWNSFSNFLTSSSLVILILLSLINWFRKIFLIIFVSQSNW